MEKRRENKAKAKLLKLNQAPKEKESITELQSTFLTPVQKFGNRGIILIYLKT